MAEPAALTRTPGDSLEASWSAPILLEDAPATADEFGGGHARLARSLAGIIRDERGGRAIALTGSYGSGKSTVVQLAEAELQSESVAVFTFDTWAHSGDPLRRSFVEEFVADLVRRGWATDEDWTDDLLRLSRQRDTTTIKSSPKLTPAGVFLALALLFAPLGTALLAKNEIGAARGGAGAFLLLLPFVVVAVAWWVRRRRGESDSVFGDLIPLLVRDRELETTTDTIRTPDPTTVEFEDVFRRVAGQALVGKRKLVVVVDNLDRLLPAEATAAWAVMRTFIDGAARTAWENRLWIVAPLDLGGIAVRTAKPEGERAGRQPEDDLITKTFTATLRVPPPVLTEWRDFFDAQLSKAFPYWVNQTGELRAVYELFLRLRSATKGPPTPRAVKSFINRLVALDHQWRGDIPLRTLALYLLVSDGVSPDGHEIGFESFVPADVQSLLGASDLWRRDLAAVHFNVEPDKAFQVLIGERVETALETGNDDRLRELVGTVGLSESILSVVRSAAPKWSLDQMARAAATLSGADIERTPGLDGAWTAIARVVIQRRADLLKENLDISAPNTQRGLATLVREAREEMKTDVAITIARSLSDGATLSVSSDPEKGITTPRLWALTAGALADAVQGSSERSLSRLNVPAIDGDSYLLTLAEVAVMLPPDARTITARHARPGGGITKPSAVIDSLVERVENETFAEIVRALDILPNVTTPNGALIAWEWDTLVVALQRAADSDTGNSSPVEVGAVVNALLRLSKVPKSTAAANKALATLTTDAFLRQLAVHAGEAEATGPITIALLSRSSWVKKPAVEPTATTAGTQQMIGYRQYELIQKASEEHEQAVRIGVSSAPPKILQDILRKKWVPRGDARLIQSVSRTTADRDDSDDVFDIETLLRLGQPAIDALADRYSQMVGVRVADVGWAGVPTTIWTLSRSGFEAVTSALDSEGAQGYRNAVVETYTNMDKDTWTEIVESEWLEARALAVQLAVEGGRVGPGAELTTALLEFVGKVASGNPEAVPEESAELYSLLPIRAREGFLSRLRAIVLDTGLPGLRAVVGGPYVSDLARAVGWERDADRVVSAFLPDVVDKGRGDEVAWVADLFESSPELLAASDSGLNASLLDRVEGRYQRKSRSSGIVRDGLLRIENSLLAYVPRSRRKKKGLAKLAEDAKAVLFGSTTPVRRNQTGDSSKPSDQSPSDETEGAAEDGG